MALSTVMCLVQSVAKFVKPLVRDRALNALSSVNLIRCPLTVVEFFGSSSSETIGRDVFRVDFWHKFYDMAGTTGHAYLSIFKGFPALAKTADYWEFMSQFHRRVQYLHALVGKKKCLSKQLPAGISMTIREDLGVLDLSSCAR